MFLDNSKLNVRFTPEGMNPDDVPPFPNVEDEGACGDNRAWYYDDPKSPSEVLLCPAACETVGGGLGGEMEIVFGCDTIPLE